MCESVRPKLLCSWALNLANSASYRCPPMLVFTVKELTLDKSLSSPSQDAPHCFVVQPVAHCRGPAGGKQVGQPLRHDHVWCYDQKDEKAYWGWEIFTLSIVKMLCCQAQTLSLYVCLQRSQQAVTIWALKDKSTIRTPARLSHRPATNKWRT